MFKNWLFFLCICFGTAESFAMRSLMKKAQGKGAQRRSVGIWRVTPHRVVGLDRPSIVIEGAESPTYQHIEGQYGKPSFGDFSFERAAHCLLRKKYDVDKKAARGEYVRLLRVLIAYEQMNDSHDVFYHGTNLLGAMLFRRYLWNDSRFLLRDPGDCRHIEDVEDIASYVAKEAQTINKFQSVRASGKYLGENRVVDWRADLRTALLSVNRAACANSWEPGESSFKWLLMEELGERSVPEKLKAAGLKIAKIPALPVLAFWSVVYNIFDMFIGEHPEETDAESPYVATLLKYGCSQEMAEHYTQELEHTSSELARAMVQISLPTHLRKSWYYSHPFGEPMSPEEMFDTQCMAEKELKFFDKTQARIRMDIFETQPDDISTELYVVGQEQALNESLEKLQDIATEVQKNV